jgi:ABC-type lipoprotein release transport system permease subunit
MLQALRLGWRNLWRNKGRTAITLGAISLATAILVITDALLKGMVVHMVRNATDLVVGEAQAHAPGYLKDRSLYKEVEEASDLVALGTKSAGAMFWGVSPVLEQEVSDLAEHLQAGSFVGQAGERRMLLGRKLARSLHAELGSEVVVVVQAADGSLGNELFVVGGILEAVGENLDRSGALIHERDFDELFVTGGRVHEIAFNTRGRMPLVDLEALLEEVAPRAEIKSWRELLPIVSDMANMIGGVIWILGGIFFLAAGLGVLNTLLMAGHERVPEFGVLKAIGTSPMRIIGDVAAEACVLGCLGTSIGGIIGAVGGRIFETRGIDTSALAGAEVSIGGVVWDPVWRAVLTPESVVLPVILMWVVCLVASLYPPGPGHAANLGRM